VKYDVLDFVYEMNLYCGLKKTVLNESLAMPLKLLLRSTIARNNKETWI